MRICLRGRAMATQQPPQQRGVAGKAVNIVFFVFDLTQRLAGQPKVCLSGLIREFLAWRLSGFTIQTAADNSEVLRHWHRQHGKDRPLRNVFAHGIKKYSTVAPDDASGKRRTKPTV